MVLNKRAVFFTIASILFVAALILLFTGVSQSQQIDTATITAQTTNSFREKLELSYIPAVLSHYSYLLLYNLSSDAYNRGLYLVLPVDYVSAATNATYKGTGAIYNAIPGATSLSTAFTNLTQAASQIGYNLTINVNSINITQVSAWQAAYTANISYNLSSQDNSVTFRENIALQGVFAIMGVPDLYYNTKQKAKAWNDYRYLEETQTKTWNDVTFLAFVNSRTYDTNNNSPSFFNRLQGINAPSPYGVQTIIPTSITPTSTASASNTSLDWQYFTPVTFNCTYTAVYPNLRMDISGIAAYNITGTSISSGSNCPPGP